MNVSQLVFPANYVQKLSAAMVNSYIDINEMNNHLLTQTIQNTENTAYGVGNPVAYAVHVVSFVFFF